MRGVAAVLTGLVVLTGLAAGPDARQRKVSAPLRFLEYSGREGLEVRLPGLTTGASGGCALPATIRFAGPPDEETLALLEAAGVQFTHVSGRRLHVGTLYPVRVLTSALAFVEMLPEVVRVEAHLAVPQPAITDNAAELTEALSAWNTEGADGQPLGGSGVTVGVIDSWIDLFHPSFFRADGGYFDWVDVDGDGVFLPGIDGVDFDHDGTVGPKEILWLLKGTVSQGQDWGQPPVIENDGKDFVPDLDWLYLDQNKTGKREFGTKPGFAEGSPAYGEPLFLADDVDGSGSLDPGEKIVLLKTSKIAAIYVPLAGQTFERGKNLIEYDPGTMDESHATMTVGVLAGNDRIRSRIRGVAPDADILLADMFSAYEWMQSEEQAAGAYVEGLLWLAEHGAQLVMHEYGSPIFEFGDGSSDMEQAIDQVLAEKGVPSTTAAHNYAGYPMHGSTVVPPGDMVPFDIALSVYAEYPDYAEYLTRVFYATVRWRSPDVPVTMELELPDGTKRTLAAASFEEELENHYFWYTGQETSPRGTVMANIVLYPKPGFAPDGVPGALEAGSYVLRVENPSNKPLPVDLFVSDQFGYFVSGKLETYATQEGTIAPPATADSAISTGAMRANNDSWGGEVPIGGLSWYSGRGPRIDGVLSLDVVAPSDALAAWHDPKTAYPLFTYAGGTSGALPQVTGMLALLLQADPAFPRDKILDRLWETAMSDSFTGKVPNNDWGYGKISAYRTVFGKAPDGNLPPVANVTAPDTVYLDQAFLLDASPSSDAQDGPDALTVRWDVGYDGIFENPYSADKLLPLGPLGKPGPLPVLAEVRDSGGASARVLVRIEVLDETTPLPPEPLPEVGPEMPADVGSADGGALDVAGGELSAAEGKADVQPGSHPGGNGCAAGMAPVSTPSSPGIAGVLLLALALLLRRSPGRRGSSEPH